MKSEDDDMRFIHFEWEGPFPMVKLKKLGTTKGNGLYYQICGDYPVFGQQVLLYTVQAPDQRFRRRLAQHERHKEAVRAECHLGRLAGSRMPSVTEARDKK